MSDKPLVAPHLERQEKYPTLIKTAPGIKIPGSGRPKGKPNIKTVFLKILNFKCNEDLTMLGLSTVGLPPEDVALLTNEEVIAMQITAKALRGDIAAAQIIYDRTEGKPVQINHNLNAEATYTEFLEKLAEDERDAVESLLS